MRSDHNQPKPTTKGPDRNDNASAGSKDRRISPTNTGKGSGSGGGKKK